MSCQYKDILGAERTGLHAYRTPGDFALVDLLLTALAAYLLADNLITALIIFILLIIISIPIHSYFCVPTTTNKMLGI